MVLVMFMLFGRRSTLLGKAGVLVFHMLVHACEYISRVVLYIALLGPLVSSTGRRSNFRIQRPLRLFVVVVFFFVALRDSFVGCCGFGLPKARHEHAQSVFSVYYQGRCLPCVAPISTTSVEISATRGFKQRPICRRDFSRSQSICPVLPSVFFFMPCLLLFFCLLFVVCFLFIFILFLAAGRGGSTQGGSGGCALIVLLSSATSRIHIVVLSCPTYRPLYIIF